MVTRRGFLGAMLGAAMAPAIVRSENLMKIFVPPEPKILVGRGLISNMIHLDELGLANFQPGFIMSKNISRHHFSTADSGNIWTITDSDHGTNLQQFMETNIRARVQHKELLRFGK